MQTGRQARRHFQFYHGRGRLRCPDRHIRRRPVLDQLRANRPELLSLCRIRLWDSAVRALASTSSSTCDTIRRAFSLSSAGTTYQGACLVLVALRHFLIHPHVVLPEFSLLDVRHAEFPVLFRFVDAVEEPLALLLLGKMQEELDDPGAVAVQMLLPDPGWSDIAACQIFRRSAAASGRPSPRRISGCTRTISTSS